jgi:hypothetical protein
MSPRAVPLDGQSENAQEAYLFGAGHTIVTPQNRIDIEGLDGGRRIKYFTLRLP